MARLVVRGREGKKVSCFELRGGSGGDMLMRELGFGGLSSRSGIFSIASMGRRSRLQRERWQVRLKAELSKEMREEKRRRRSNGL